MSWCVNIGKILTIYLLFVQPKILITIVFSTTWKILKVISYACSNLIAKLKFKSLTIIKRSIQIDKLKAKVKSCVAITAYF